MIISRALNSYNFSLRTVMTVSLIVFIGVLTFLTLYFAYEASRYATFRITERLMYQFYLTTAQRLDYYFEFSDDSLNDIEYAIKEVDFDFKNNPQEFFKYLKRQLLINTKISEAYVGDENGNLYMAKRMSDGTISFRQVSRKRDAVTLKWVHDNKVYNKAFPDGRSSLKDGYDPREQVWYQKAMQEGKKIWTEPYILEYDKLMGISVATPISAPGIKGILGLSFKMAEITEFISELPISKIGTVFILDNRDKVITYSSPQRPSPQLYKSTLSDDGERNMELLALSDIKDRLLTSVYKDYTYQQSINNRSFYDNVFLINLLARFVSAFVGQDKLHNDEFLFDIQEHKGSMKTDSDHLVSKSFYCSCTFEDNRYLFMVHALKIVESFDTKLGIVIPESVVISYFQRTYQIILFVTIFVVIVGICGIITIMHRSISRPIFDLSERMLGMVNNFQLEEPVYRKTKLKEVQHINNSIESVRKAIISFKKFLPQEVVADLIKSGKEATLGGKKKEVTLLFTDIQDFTTISEENPSDILLDRLQKYFDICYQSVREHGGVLDKYIGDAVMAMWGVLGRENNHPVSACLAALQFKQLLLKLNHRHKREEFPEFHTRIGIHTGVALVGNIGSTERLNYTCLGDTVNLASRIEGLNKFYKTQILASNMTLQHAKNFVESRMIDRVFVRGKTQRVLLHEIIAKKGELNSKASVFLSYYKRGLHYYFRGEWDKCRIFLDQALKLKPLDAVTKLYLDKAESFVGKNIENIEPSKLYLSS